MMRQTELKVYTVERVDAPINSNESSDLRFGRPENGAFWMLGKDDVGTMAARDLHRLVQSQTGIVIEFIQSEGEYKESYKYIVNTKALESLLHKFSLKVDGLARASRWGELELPESSFTQLHRFIERPFLSGHCLISGIDSHRMPRGTEQQRQKAVEDMCKVVIGDGVVQMSSEDASMLSRGIANPIRVRNLGWEKLKNDRPSY
jgi:hypothetical protein